MEVKADPIVLCGIDCMKMCRFVCVVANQLKLETVTPYGKCLLAYYMREGCIEEGERIGDVMYQCATCGLCKEWCLPRVDVPEIMKEVRATLVEQGLAPKSTVEMAEKTVKERNPYGEPHRNRFSSIKERRAGKGEVAYFVGCTTAYRQPSIAESTVKILKTAGDGYTLVGDEWCCGAPLAAVGYKKLAEEHAKHNKEAIEALDCSVLVTSCAGCYMALSKEYPNLNASLNVEVLHVTQYVRRRIDEGKIKLGNPFGGKDVKVTYHDPCHLGRHCGVYDEPREILRSIPGVQLVEMEWSRANSKCCGSGGGLQVNFPELSERIGRDRVNEAIATGASILVTACPFCKVQFEKVAEGEIEVYDLIELVAMSIK
ncbi:MAG: (Fe-S)-binding protein [Candidatus Freyarchaeota archaeon]|nr:(Fe-S)-binding protein [Candidatus Freyrarchaeum guaymaensis]